MDTKSRAWRNCLTPGLLTGLQRFGADRQDACRNQPRAIERECEIVDCCCRTSELWARILQRSSSSFPAVSHAFQLLDHDGQCLLGTLAGMMKPASDSFFSYAFVFELQSKPELTEAVVKDEFLKYYRGLCKRVLDGKAPNVDPSKFTLELQRQKSDAKPQPNENDADAPALYTGTLDWIEPFATKKPQKLHLEIRTWTQNDRNFIFACVSPQARDTAIWKQLHAIRDGYLKKPTE